MTLAVRPLAIPGIKLLTPKRFADTRGVFFESFNAQAFTAAGLQTAWVQDNQSLSLKAGTVRGLHFQKPPHAQAKLISVLAGRIFDVAVDIRKSSPTFGRFVSVELDAETGAELFVPQGFAHGFCTLAPSTLVMYKVDAHYAPEADAGIFWADEDIGIDWPVGRAQALLSPKDEKLPRLKDIATPF